MSIQPLPQKQTFTITVLRRNLDGTFQIDIQYPSGLSTKNAKYIIQGLKEEHCNPSLRGGKLSWVKTSKTFFYKNKDRTIYKCTNDPKISAVKLMKKNKDGTRKAKYEVIKSNGGNLRYDCKTVPYSKCHTFPYSSECRVFNGTCIEKTSAEREGRW